MCSESNCFQQTTCHPRSAFVPTSFISDSSQLGFWSCVLYPCIPCQTWIFLQVQDATSSRNRYPSVECLAGQCCSITASMAAGWSGHWCHRGATCDKVEHSVCGYWWLAYLTFLSFLVDISKLDTISRLLSYPRSPSCVWFLDVIGNTCEWTKLCFVGLLDRTLMTSSTFESALSDCSSALWEPKSALGSQPRTARQKLCLCNIVPLASGVSLSPSVLQTICDDCWVCLFHTQNHTKARLEQVIRRACHLSTNSTRAYALSSASWRKGIPSTFLL